MRKQKKTLKEVDLFSYKLDHKMKHEKCLNISAICIILGYSMIVSISYDNQIRYNVTYQLIYSIFVCVFTIGIFGTMAFFFIRATLIMKQASEDFNLGFNKITYMLNLIVIVFEVFSAVAWSVGLLISAT